MVLLLNIKIWHIFEEEIVCTIQESCHQNLLSYQALLIELDYQEQHFVHKEGEALTPTPPDVISQDAEI